MAEIRLDLPTEQVAKMTIQIRRGDVALAAIPPGQPGAIVITGDDEILADVETSIVGDEAIVTQRRSFDFGHEKIRLEADVPSSVRSINLSTGHGDVVLQGLDLELTAQTGYGSITGSIAGGRVDGRTGHGDLRLSGRFASSRLTTGHGDIQTDAISGDVDVRTGNGDVEISEADGHVDVVTGHGDVQIGRLGGEVRVNTGHGDVSIEKTDTRRADVHTGNGDIQIAEARGSVRAGSGHGDVSIHARDGAQIEADTGNGEISVEGSLGTSRLRSGRGEISCAMSAIVGDVDVFSAAGDLDVALPEGASVRVDLTTRKGKIESNLPLVKVGRPGPEGMHGRRFVASIGEGSPTVAIRARTERGDVRVAAAGGEPSKVWQGDEPFDRDAWMRMGPPPFVGREISREVHHATRDAMRGIQDAMDEFRHQFRGFDPNLGGLARGPYPPHDRFEARREDRRRRWWGEPSDEPERAEPVGPTPPESPSAAAWPMGPTQPTEPPMPPRPSEPSAAQPATGDADVPIASDVPSPTGDRLSDAPHDQPQAPESATSSMNLPTDSTSDASSQSEPNPEAIRVQILQAVQNGEVSVDEAMELLSRLESLTKVE